MQLSTLGLFGIKQIEWKEEFFIHIKSQHLNKCKRQKICHIQPRNYNRSLQNMKLLTHQSKIVLDKRLDF